MITILTSRRPGPATRTALTVALLIGAGHQAFAHGSTGTGAVQIGPVVGMDRAIEQAEAAVAKAPQDSARRAALGQAYMHSGRFESAVTALHDAVMLGDVSERTVLGLALSQAACGQDRAALATLDGVGATVSPADLGLALALAGAPERGVAVLTDGVRDGPASSRLRQNLAYAYALAGRWADARLTASFDLPPDQLDVRLQQWAQSMQFGGERVRVAQILNAPIIVDQGMPDALALGGVKTTPPPAPAVAPELAIAKTKFPAELPRLADPFPAVAAPVKIAMAPLPVKAAWQPPAPRLVVRIHHPATKSGHVIQLGAFSSVGNAERARLILARHNPQLRGHGFLITQAHVNGRNYWRVVTSGFDGATAANTCASLKRHGGACFAYAVDHAPQRASLALVAPVKRSAYRP